MTWTVSAVPFEAIEDMWPTVLPMLAPAIAMSEGRVDEDAVLEGLHNHTYVLWIVYPPDLGICAAAVSHTAVYPRKRVLSIDLLGGNGLEDWLPEVVHIFRRFAHEQGLAGVEMVGRLGWLKPLTRLGWKRISVVCEIDALSGSGVSDV